MKLLRTQISVCIFLVQLSCKDIVDFHCTVMRPVLEYCSPIFHRRLPHCLSERVQKRALSKIAPDKSYKHCLVSFSLITLYDRRNDQYIKLFNSISSDQHKFACLLSPNLQGSQVSLFLLLIGTVLSLVSLLSPTMLFSG